MEYEWYENVRNGFTPLCDRCNENINRDEFLPKGITEGYIVIHVGIGFI